MIRVKTLWPHRVGGVTFLTRDGGRWRFNRERTASIGEGNIQRRLKDDWIGPGRERRITWWRVKLANRRRDDRAARRT